MAAFLSPGVYLREVVQPTVGVSSGEIIPVFFGTAKKGPMNTPTLVTNAQEAINTFGTPFSDSYLMYAVMAYFEEGGACYIVRVGVECEDGQESGLSSICIDTSGNKIEGWGRLPIFTGIDFGRIDLGTVSSEAPLVFHPASVGTVYYNDADSSSTHGDTDATLSVSGTYTGSIDDAYTLNITSDPDLSSSSAMDGASFEVVQGSTGVVVASGDLDEAVLGQSQPISIGNGLTITVVVTDGVLATNDTFIFNVQPDNRKFKFSVEGVAGSEYTMPTATYTSVSDFVTAFNALLSGESYAATTSTDANGNTIPQIRTSTAGRWIQLMTTAGWAVEVGTQQYAWDIPRSYLIGAEVGPYNIKSNGNLLSLKVIGETTTTSVSFTMATGTSLTAAQVAANIDPAGVQSGGTYFDSFALTIPGGTSHVVIVTTTDYQYNTLQLLANYSYIKTLRLAEELGISFPYKRGYRGFSDTRVELPTGSESDSSVPASCDVSPTGTQCTDDTAYYQNIVGFLVASSPGTWLNNYKVTLEIFTEGIGEVAGRFKLVIKDNQGTIVESISDVSFDPRATRYVGNILNPGSSLGGKNGNEYLHWEARPSYLNNTVGSTDFEVRVPSAFSDKTLSGMTDGIPASADLSSELDAALIGSPALGTGLYSISNPETYNVNLLLTPGFSSGPVIAAGLTVAENRGDMVYIIDPPVSLEADEVVDWHNGMLLSSLSSAINSSYGALYYPWYKVFDQFNRTEIYIPPSGGVSAVYSRTSREAELWSAPAGLTRGRILTALQLQSEPNLDARNLLYGNGNAVNPLVNFPNDGIVVYGQRTLQRSNSSTDRVNVRMLMNHIKVTAIDLLRQFVFEPNDAITRSQVLNVIEPFIADIKARRGLTAYKVVCDSTNNTATRIDQGQLWVDVFIQPTIVAEFIVLSLVALQTEASFSTQESLAATGVVT